MSRTVIPVSGDGFAAYEVVVGRDLMPELGQRVAALVPGRTVVVADETVAAVHGPRVMAALEAANVRARLLTVPPGEGSKSFTQLEHVLDRLAAFELDRKDTIVALGGGVVGDLAGLAAALYMRGIGVVQVPTTLLAQVDSSVGGKTAIDTPRGKNLIGAFHHPSLVVADIDLLKTLPERQLRSGWAEVIKHGLICDADFFDWLAGQGASGALGDPVALDRAVVRSVEIKARIVGEDQKEAGRRALLNLGHTFGHAIEADLNFDETKLTHGEAVALGCALALRFSAHEGHCSPEDAARAEAVIAAAGLPTRLHQVGTFQAETLVRWMAGDKKAESGRLTLILGNGIGDTFVAKAVDADRVAAFLKAEGAL